MITASRRLLPWLILPFLSLSPVHPADRNKLCDSSVFLKGYANALELFISKEFKKSALVLEPFLNCKLPRLDAASLHLTLGRNYQELGQKEVAVQEFSKSLTFNPKSVHAYTNRGLVLASLGRLEDANRDLTKAIGIDSSSFIALSNRGVVYATQGNFNKATLDFDASIKLNPNFGEAYINRGIVRELIGDLAGACSDWKRAIQLRQFSARSWVADQCDT